MGRRYVYLGRRVRDAPPRGLSSVREVRDISGAIVRDYQRGRISRATAVRRLNLLKLAVQRSSRMRGKRRSALKVINSRLRRVERREAAKRK